MKQTRVKRHPERGAYEREQIDAILDEALYCHLGFVVDVQPYVIPTIHTRLGDVLYVHGSPASRMLRTLAEGMDICVTVTLLDGLVLARSVYNHSMNYRSAVVLGRARSVDGDEKLRALEAIVEHVVPGRWRDARLPTEKELAGTSVLALGLVFCTMTLVWLAVYTVVVARAGAVLRRARVRRAIEGVTGTALIALGLRLAGEQRAAP